MKKKLTLLASVFLAATGFAQTGNPAPYCVSQFDNNYNMVQSVGINGTNFNVGPVGSFGAQNSYTFFNNAVFPSLSLNGTATVAVSFYSVTDWEPRYFGVWIDYDSNNAFDPGELIMNNANTTFTDLPTGGGAPVTASLAITVPGTASPGVKRMRLVRSQNPVGSPYVAYSSTVQVLACNPIASDFAYGCTYDFTLNILGGAPVANFAVSPANVCAGKTVTLTDLSTNSPATWAWSAVGASNTLSAIQNPTLVYTTAGTYTIGLMSGNNAGVSALVTKTIVVQASPQLTVSPANTTVCAKKSTTLAVSGASTYSWSTGAGGVMIVVSPTITTVYTVVGTASNGCSSALSKTLTVVPCVGLDELTGNWNEQTAVFPNPFNGQLNFKTFYGKVRMYNELGQVVFEGDALETLDTSHLPSGIYIIKMTNELGNQKSFRVIKTN